MGTVWHGLARGGTVEVHGDSMATPIVPSAGSGEAGAGIVSGDADHELFDVGLGERTSRPPAKGRAVELPGDHGAVSFEDRLGPDYGDGVGYQLAEGDGLLSKATEFVVGQPKALVEMVAQDTVLFQQILDPA